MHWLQKYGRDWATNTFQHILYKSIVVTYKDNISTRFQTSVKSGKELKDEPSTAILKPFAKWNKVLDLRLLQLRVFWYCFHMLLHHFTTLKNLLVFCQQDYRAEKVTFCFSYPLFYLIHMPILFHRSGIKGSERLNFAPGHRVSRCNVEFNLTSVFFMGHKIDFMHLFHYHCYVIIRLAKW